MRSLLELTFGSLWAPLGPLLGGSWASLGCPWASKMGSKRVTDIGIRVSFIPSCFFCRFFRLRSASGSLLGRILAPSWCHLGPSWNDFSRFLVDFLGCLVDFGVHADFSLQKPFWKRFLVDFSLQKTFWKRFLGFWVDFLGCLVDFGVHNE